MKVATVLALLAVTASASAAPEEAKKAVDNQSPVNTFTSCGFPGSICAKTKRAALAVAEALHEGPDHDHRHKFSFCNYPGAHCDRAKRSLEKLGTTTQETMDKVLLLDRDASASQYFYGYRFPWNGAGSAAANAAGGAGFAGLHHGKREARAYYYRPHNYYWSSCGPPGAICAKSKRGLELLKEDYPNIHKEECFAEGGECNRVLKARAAFDQAVKAEPAPGLTPWLECGKNGITCAPDVYDFAEASYAGNATAFNPATCQGSKGECEKAEQYFKQLDAALSQATEEVLKA